MLTGKCTGTGQLGQFGRVLEWLGLTVSRHVDGYIYIILLLLLLLLLLLYYIYWI